MAITLRTDSGSALTYAQVDTNFTSLFYSASLSGSTLTFFRTGSSGLGIPRTSASFSLVTDSYWTSSNGAISRLGQVSVTGSFLNGVANIATGQYSHAQGSGSRAAASGSHAEGRSTQATGEYSHAEGISTIASGQFSHAEGTSNIASATGSHAEGSSTSATGQYSHAEGNGTIASGSYSHAEGSLTQALGYASHAEGDTTQAKGDNSHAEGSYTIASGSYSHAEGIGNIALGPYSHAEGSGTRAIGDYSHAEGGSTKAAGENSHAEGFGTQATGYYAHAEGDSTLASSAAAHAEGRYTTASGNWSHTEGLNTVALGDYQHVQGQYNISSSAQSAFIIGNGTSNSNRSNLVFASGSFFQVSGSIVLPGSGSVYFGDSVLGTTSSYAIFRDYQNRLTIGNYVGSSGYGTNGIKIDTAGKIQLNTVSQDYGLYDTTLNIIGSGSNDGITLTQHPDTVNKYKITVQSGSVSTLNFWNSAGDTLGSFNFTGSVNIKDVLKLQTRSTLPTGVEGMLVSSGSTGSTKLCYFDGTRWYTVNLTGV